MPYSMRLATTVPGFDDGPLEHSRYAALEVLALYALEAYGRI